MARNVPGVMALHCGRISTNTWKDVSSRLEDGQQHAMLGVKGDNQDIYTWEGPDIQLD